MKIEVGPQSYDPKFELASKKVRTTYMKEKVVAEPAVGSVKQQMEGYLEKIFDDPSKT